ncbi:unnamed protein product, partial [Allacma fusca]
MRDKKTRVIGYHKWCPQARTRTVFRIHSDLEVSRMRMKFSKPMQN